MSEASAHLVSVVIPAYNAAAFIQQSVECALAQTWSSREVLVINDGSTDDTEDLLETYGNHIRIINKPNGGLSSARNRGIQEAKGEFIAFLDADDRWLPGKLARQVELMAAHPDTGFCSTTTLVETPDGEVVNEWTCPTIEGTLLQTLFLENAAIPGSGSGIMVRRKIFDQIDLFDESLRSLEDIDMWMRLAAVTDYQCIDEPLTVIVKHPDSMSRNMGVMRDSALRVMHKNRLLLSDADQRGIWRAGYASVLADYAKWEYRQGQHSKAVAHLLQGLRLAPLSRGRLIIGLLIAVILRRPL